MEVKIISNEFSLTKAKVDTAAEKLRQYHNEQQSVFCEPVSSWQGIGGDSFRSCTQEISLATLTGILAVASLSSQTTIVKEYLAGADATLASSISE